MTQPIEDGDASLIEQIYPSDTARGWRRAGCFVLVVAGLVLLVLGLAATFTFGDDAEGADELCEDLQIQLTYLDAVASADEARADIVRQMDEADCDQ